MRLSKNKYSFKDSELNCKMAVHAIETDHQADFSHLKVLISNTDNYNSRIFLEGWYTSTQRASINSACTKTLENTIFL